MLNQHKVPYHVGDGTAADYCIVALMDAPGFKPQDFDIYYTDGMYETEKKLFISGMKHRGQWKAFKRSVPLKDSHEADISRLEYYLHAGVLAIIAPVKDKEHPPIPLHIEVHTNQDDGDSLDDTNDSHTKKNSSEGKEEKLPRAWRSVSRFGLTT